MMRKGGGKQKGAQFERDACRDLSLWVSGGKHEDVFWRSAMSGGRSTVAQARGKRLAAQAGDISCIHPSGETFSMLYLCECKFYADLNITGLITNTGKLVKFWRETMRAADKYKKFPFLIAKQNRLPTLICLDTHGATHLCLFNKTLLLVPYLNLSIFFADTFFTHAVPPR